MKIIFAKDLGFCFGVKRAIEIAENSLEKDPKPVQFLGSLIHNEKVIENIRKKGGKFINSIKDIKTGTLISRAHGIPYETMEKIKRKKVLIKDTTCPLVEKVQEGAAILLKQGYQVSIIGEKKHPETKSINSYAKNQAIVIENENQAENLPNIERIGAVCQTTQNLKNIEHILKILKDKSKKLKWINTSCPTVANRQKELLKILKKVEGVIVIGSRSSANTASLAQIVKNSSKTLWWVNSEKELKKEKFRKISSIGIVSGTSAPDWEIEKIKIWLFQNFNSPKASKTENE